MSIEEFRKLQLPPGRGPALGKPNKYRNAITMADGIRFDSKAEARRYRELKLLKAAGEIQWFNRQPSFVIARGARYIPDFIVCGKDGVLWVEDVKSPVTAKNSTFVLKAKLFTEQYPTLELRIVR
jgi:hypothetical protein